MHTNEIRERFSTLKALPWFEATNSSEYKYLKNVFVLGAGGIGSWLSLFLVRAGFTIILYDFDEVEERNLGGQFYKVSDIGKKKVNCVAENVAMFTSTSTSVCYQSNRFSRFESHYSTVNIFAAFDNMQSRKEAFESWLHIQKYFGCQKNIFIDGRLEAEFFQIYCVRSDKPEQIEEYKKTLDLRLDNVSDNTLCSAKQTTHVAAMIGSYMVAFYTNFITNIIEDSEARFVPFKFEVFTPLVVHNEYGE